MPGHANFVGGPAARVRRKLSAGSSSTQLGGHRRRNILSLGLGSGLGKPKKENVSFDFTWAPSAVQARGGGEWKVGKDGRGTRVDASPAREGEDAKSRRKGIAQLLDEDLSLGGFQAGRQALLAMDDWAGLGDFTIPKPPPTRRHASSRRSRKRKVVSSSPGRKSRVSTIPEEEENEDETGEEVDESGSEEDGLQEEGKYEGAYMREQASDQGSAKEHVIAQPVPRHSVTEQPLFSLALEEDDDYPQQPVSIPHANHRSSSPLPLPHSPRPASTTGQDQPSIAHGPSTIDSAHDVALAHPGTRHNVLPPSPLSEGSEETVRSATRPRDDDTTSAAVVKDETKEQQREHHSFADERSSIKPDHHCSSSTTGDSDATRDSLKRKAQPSSSSSAGSASTGGQTKRPRTNASQRVSLRLAGPPPFVPTAQRQSPIDMVPPIDPPASLADDLFPDPVPLDVAHEEEVASAAEPPPLQNPFAHLSTALGFDDISGDASPMKPRTSSRTVSDDGMSENDEEPVDVGGTSSGDDRSEETQVFARDLDGGSRDDSQESTGSYDDDEGTGQEQSQSFYDDDEDARSNGRMSPTPVAQEPQTMPSMQTKSREGDFTSMME